MEVLLIKSKPGLYGAPGDSYIDPHQSVKRAIVTHAHGDHAWSGCRRYWAAKPSEDLLWMRMDDDAQLKFLAYGKSVSFDGVEVSFHPAGHILGSAQVRLERPIESQCSAVTTSSEKLLPARDGPQCRSV